MSIRRQAPASSRPKDCLMQPPKRTIARFVVSKALQSDERRNRRDCPDLATLYSELVHPKEKRSREIKPTTRLTLSIGGSSSSSEAWGESSEVPTPLPTRPSVVQDPSSEKQPNEDKGIDVADVSANAVKKLLSIAHDLAVHHHMQTWRGDHPHHHHTKVSAKKLADKFLCHGSDLAHIHHTDHYFAPTVVEEEDRDEEEKGGDEEEEEEGVEEDEGMKPRKEIWDFHALRLLLHEAESVINKSRAKVKRKVVHDSMKLRRKRVLPQLKKGYEGHQLPPFSGSPNIHRLVTTPAMRHNSKKEKFRETVPQSPNKTLENSYKYWVQLNREKTGLLNVPTTAKEFPFVQELRNSFQSLLQPLDLVVAVAHCAECSSHGKILHHDSSKYHDRARAALKAVVEGIIELELPIRLGCLLLPYRFAYHFDSRFADDDNSAVNEEVAPFIRMPCGVSDLVPIGSLEVFVAFKTCASELYFSEIFSKLATKKWPSLSNLNCRLRQFLAATFVDKPIAPVDAVVRSTSVKEGEDTQGCAYPDCCPRGCGRGAEDNCDLFESVKDKIDTLMRDDAIFWIADLCHMLQAAHHKWKVGDAVLVNQVAPMLMSPRRTHECSVVHHKSASSPFYFSCPISNQEARDVKAPPPVKRKDVHMPAWAQPGWTIDVEETVEEKDEREYNERCCRRYPAKSATSFSLEAHYESGMSPAMTLKNAKQEHHLPPLSSPRRLLAAEQEDEDGEDADDDDGGGGGREWDNEAGTYRSDLVREHLLESGAIWSKRPFSNVSRGLVHDVTHSPAMVSSSSAPALALGAAKTAIGKARPFVVAKVSKGQSVGLRSEHSTPTRPSPPRRGPPSPTHAHAQAHRKRDPKALWTDQWYSQGHLKGLVTAVHSDGTYDICYLVSGNFEDKRKTLLARSEERGSSNINFSDLIANITRDAPIDSNDLVGEGEMAVLVDYVDVGVPEQFLKEMPQEVNVHIDYMALINSNIRVPDMRQAAKLKAQHRPWRKAVRADLGEEDIDDYDEIRASNVKRARAFLRDTIMLYQAIQSNDDDNDNNDDKDLTVVCMAYDATLNDDGKVREEVPRGIRLNLTGRGIEQDAYIDL